MARNLLTVKEIVNATKPKLRDGDGLWLHASKGGGRYWVFIFTRFGRRREMGLGPFGAGTGHVTLAAARAKAEEIRTILGSGGDPFKDMVERKAQMKPATFGQIADEYIATMKSNWRGAKTLAAWERFAKAYIKGIRKVPVAEVATEDILRVLRPIWQEKQETAGKVRERIKLVLDHARARGLRSGDNPAIWKGHLDQILPAQDGQGRGHHPAMPYLEIPEFMIKLRGAKGIGARCLEFSILNATRPGEARGAVWSEIDFDAAVWTIPAARMKEQREHRIPLSDASLTIIKSMREISISDFVFAGAKAKRPLSDMTLLKVMKSTGAGAFVPHGFRSAFRDWAAEETAHQREVAEAALAHAVGDQVERAYRRGDALKKRRILMNDWAIFCGGGNG